MFQVASPDFGSMAWRADSCEDPFALKAWPTDEQIQQANRRTPRPSRAESAFSFAQRTSPAQQSAPSLGDGLGASNATLPGSAHVVSSTPWSPQQSDDPLHGFRASIQNGELSKFADSGLAGQIDRMHLFPHGVHSSNSHNNNHGNGSGNINNNNPSNNGGTELNKHRNSVSSGSTDSLEFASASQTTWSAVVQKNPRPMRQQRNRGPRPSKTFTVNLAACCATPKIKLTCACCNEESFVKVREELRPRVIPVATSQLGFCRFCQSNGDPAEIYQGHSLRSDDGKVTCPVLREYNCPICNNGGGDYAHTIKYCPLARRAKPNH